MSFWNLISPYIGPPVLWRTSRWCLVLACLSVSISIGTVILRRAGLAPRQSWQMPVITVFGLAPAVVIYPVGYLVQRRTVRDWHRARGRLCAHCGYDVSALDDPGTCPECGNSYDLEQDAPMWKEVGLTREPDTDTPQS